MEEKTITASSPSPTETGKEPDTDRYDSGTEAVHVIAENESEGKSGTESELNLADNVKTENESPVSPVNGSGDRVIIENGLSEKAKTESELSDLLLTEKGTSDQVNAGNETARLSGEVNGEVEQDDSDTVKSGGGSVEEALVVKKRGRGRPRKFAEISDGDFIVAPRENSSPPLMAASSTKRSRGRPKGSGRLQLLASLGGFAMATAGGSFTPHVAHVLAGEDIVLKVTEFYQSGRRALCVLSATGSVSSAVIRQPNSSGGILRYEGRFEILSLKGSFTLSENPLRKLSMLSVSLAKPDGRVFGGAVAGPIIAATPIQLVIASFKQNIRRELRKYSVESAGSHFEGPTVAVPMQLTGVSEDDDNCTTPTSAPPAFIHGGVENAHMNNNHIFNVPPMSLQTVVGLNSTVQVKDSSEYSQITKLEQMIMSSADTNACLP